ncbi:hypothetical protein AAVH_28102 [Aphelenchoides avenae]|nr:hypothetical protein AAVH_28102 [Aphelenchus avenae]
MTGTKIYCLFARDNLQSLIRQYSILKAKQYAIDIDEALPAKRELRRLQLVLDFLQRDQYIVQNLPDRLAAARDKWAAAVHSLPDEEKRVALKQFDAFNADYGCLDIQQVHCPELMATLTSTANACEKLIEQLTRTLSGAEQPGFLSAVHLSPHVNAASSDAGSHPSHSREPSSITASVVKQQPPRKPLDDQESCAFCSHHGHRSTHCLNYGSFEKRLLRAARQSICLACCSLRPRPHLWNACPHEPLKCAFCKQAGHHQAFCRSWLKAFPSRINRSRPQTNVINTSNRGRPSSSRVHTAAPPSSSDDADAKQSSGSDDATSKGSGPQPQQAVNVHRQATRPRTTETGTSSQLQSVQGGKSDEVPQRKGSVPIQEHASTPCRLLRCTCHRDDCEYVIPLPWKAVDTIELSEAPQDPVLALTPDATSSVESAVGTSSVRMHQGGRIRNTPRRLAAYSIPKATPPFATNSAFFEAAASHVYPARSVSSNPRPEWPLPEPPLPPIRMGWSIACEGAVTSQQRPAAARDRFQAMMTSLAAPTDADIWHTCSGPLQVGAGGQPFIPGPESVVRFSQTVQKCNACTRSGRQQGGLRPKPFIQLPSDRKRRTSREHKPRKRSPPSLRRPPDDAVLNASEPSSDHELGPNPPLTEQQQAILDELLAPDNESAIGYEDLDDHEQRALEASLAELYNDDDHRLPSPSPAGEFGPFCGLEDELDELASHVAEEFYNDDGYWRPERSRSPSPSGGFGPINGREEEFVASRTAKLDADLNEQMPPANFVRLRVRHAHRLSESVAEHVQHTFRGDFYEADPYDDDFHACDSNRDHRYEDGFRQDDFYEDDSVHRA